MTRKDYEAIAAKLCAHKDQGPVPLSAEGMRRTLAYGLAAVFKAENPRFDTQRFLQACGVPQ